jgi:tetratricopeptide (TPR) repeat protein
MEKRINTIASFIFISFIFIIPVIFSASALISFQFSKIIPFFIAVFVVAFLYIVLVFNEGKIAIPWHWFFAASAFVPLMYLISALTSVNTTGSLLGTGAELATASTIGGLFIFMYLVSYFMRSKDKAFVSYLTFSAAFVLIAFFHTLRFIFGADFLSFGVFNSIISNTLGGFTDLALFSGVAVLLSLSSIEFLRLGKLVRVISYIVLGLSLVILAVTNFPLFVFGVDPKSSLSLFTFIGFFALIFFVYFVSSSYGAKEKEVGLGRRIPVASLIVLVVSLLFTLGGTPLQNAVSSLLKVEQTSEARLLWKPTANLSISTITDLPLRTFVGYGPEQFSYKWMLSKPADINNSILWNTPFFQGTGFITSTVVTVGILGFLGWLAFLGLLLWLGVRALFAKNKDPFSQYILVSSFLVSVYLWISIVVYIPNITTFIITFFFTGIFLGSLFREKLLVENEVVFDKSKGKSFAFILGLIFTLILLLLWGYKLGERVVASVYAGKASITLSSAQSREDVEKAKVYLVSAGSLANQGLYSQALALISLSQVNTILQDTTTSEDVLRQQFQTTYQGAVAYAQNAIVNNPNSFDSYISYGNVLATAVPLGLQGYYEEAKNAYTQAGNLNPKSPLVPFLMAKLEADNKNIDEAKKKIGEALALKSNYVDAIVLLGRIQAGEGKKDDAIVSLTVALSIVPGNQNIQAMIDALKNIKTVAPSATSTPSTDN